MHDRLKYNTKRSLLLFLLIFGCASTAKDHWRQVLWENGINALANSEDPYHTLLVIVEEIENEEDVSLEWSLNEIFTKLITRGQDSKNQKLSANSAKQISTHGSAQKVNEKFKLEEAVPNIKLLLAKSEGRSVSSDPSTNKVNNTDSKVPTKPIESEKRPTNTFKINDVAPKNEVETGMKPSLSLGLSKKSPSFPILKSLMSDDDDDDLDDEEPDPVPALGVFPRKNLLPKLFAIADGFVAGNPSQLVERKVTEAMGKNEASLTGKKPPAGNLESSDKEKSMLDLFPVKEAAGVFAKVASQSMSFFTDKKQQ